MKSPTRPPRNPPAMPGYVKGRNKRRLGVCELNVRTDHSSDNQRHPILNPILSNRGGNYLLRSCNMRVTTATGLLLQ